MPIQIQQNLLPPGHLLTDKTPACPQEEVWHKASSHLFYLLGKILAVMQTMGSVDVPQEAFMAVLSMERSADWDALY